MAIPIVKIENPRGHVLDFSADSRYVAILTGTGPPPATVNRSKSSTMDGTQFNSATVGERPLLLTVHLIKDVARARLDLYEYIATKQYIKVYYQNDGLDVYVEGYVETAEVNPWEENQAVQVSIICPMPFWRDVKETYTNASSVHALFELPFFTDVTESTDTTASASSTNALIDIKNSAAAPIISLVMYGKTTQNGTPTPDSPAPLEIAGDSGSIAVKVGVSETDGYPQTLTVLTPNGLPGIPVSSGGNYTDETGQMWICDEIDFARGKYVQRTKLVDMSTLSWTYTAYWHVSTISDMKHPTANTIYGQAMAEKYHIRLAKGMTNSVVGEFALDVSDIKVANGGAADTPTGLLLYALATPIETDLIAEVVAAYAALRTNEGGTVIYNDAGAEMTVEYYLSRGDGMELSTTDRNASTVIENYGTVEAGMTFVAKATMRSTNLRIYNLSTGEFIGVLGTLEPGDQLEISTATGSKRITHIRDGVRSNYINAIMEGSKWLKMAIGANEYSYTVDEGECELSVYHTNMYTGV